MAGEVKPLPQVPWNPLACSDTPMAPNTLLVAKLAFAILAVDGFPLHLGPPLAPWAEWLRVLGAVPGYGIGLHAVFWVAGAALLLNRAVRAASLAAGGIVVLAIVQSRPAFESHSLLAGFLLVLAGLETPQARPVLLRWQVVLAGVLALLPKIGNPAWVDGSVVAGWIGGELTLPPFTWLPKGSTGLAAAVAWAVVLVQAAVVCGLALPARRNHAVAAGLLLQIGLLLLVPTHAMIAWSLVLGAGMIAFADWPCGVVDVHWPRGCGWPLWLRIALDRYDWDHRLRWPLPPDPDGDLEVDFERVRLHDWRGLRAVLLHFPAFHFAVILPLLVLNRFVPAEVVAALAFSLGLAVWAFLAVPAFGRRFRHRH